MQAMASFKDLKVWNKGIELTRLSYELCRFLPAEERYGLSSQIKRAAVSIPSNIAEGYRRNNRKEFTQFCGIALGSSAELETQLIIVSTVYPAISVDVAMDMTIQVQKMLTKLLKSLA
jgi:four helix bundle protein